jgi:two-component system chemotaxis sensor kinase CheA
MSEFDSALHTYVAESRELLEEMEEALLSLEQKSEQEDDKQELLNSIFRAAHTIKGSAGLFALDDIVAFTHVVESLLDKLREHQIALDGSIIALLLQCGDHISNLIDLVDQGNLLCSADLKQRGDELLTQLGRYATQSSSATAAMLQPQQATVENMGGGYVETDNWHISLRLTPNALRDGMDPLSFLRYLGTLGQIINITTLDDAMPVLEEFDPESCYLGFEINFKSDADKQTIESVFDFVREGSTIRILPPRSRINDYIKLIHEMPEEDLRLGEILVQCGTLTHAELEEALNQQRQEPLGQVLVSAGMTHPPVVEAALEKQSQIRDGKARESQSIRVDAEKLDQLINLVGELVIAGAGTALNAHQMGNSYLIESVSTLIRLMEEVRDSTLCLRMVQIGATFNKFQRVVRDVSKELGKDIDLVITGAETDLDKTVVEKIGDPLMHLVRNSMDHGIESPEIRLSRGKSAKGTLHLNAYHDSGSIVIEVSDDGAGLNRDRILQKAIEKGLVQEGQPLDDHEIYNLIFAAGFSTADKVTNLSGRGVGMDVVKRNITALRGVIDLESTPGLGTTFRIRLPLTLAIIDGFQVEVEHSSFVVPLDMVLECVELNEEDHSASDDCNYINLRGEVLPLIRLRDLFLVPGRSPRRENVVVVHYAGNKAGLVVDHLVGEFQTVIKPLGKLFNRVRGVGGSTILGNGEVALILDVPGLVQQVTSREGRRVGTAA